MKKRYMLGLLFILLCLLIPAVSAEPEDVSIAVYVLGIDSYDQETGMYNMDFYIEFVGDKYHNVEDFEAINGRKADYYKITGEKNNTFYRVRATLIDKVELHDFPLDKQTIKLVVEHKRLPKEDIRLVANRARTGIDERIFFPGWKIEGWTAYTYDHYYELYGNTQSTYVFEIQLERHRDAALLYLLPIFIIVMLILFTFAVDPTKTELRIGIVSSALIAAIVYHLAINSKLPESTGYLTFIDQVMLLTYFILLISFILDICMLRIVQIRKVRLAHKIYLWTRYNMAIITIILYVLLFVLFFYNVL